jgi:uncharacterized protein YxjI
MLLDKNKFVVKSQSKMFSGKKDFEILDGDTGPPLGSAKDVTGFFASLFGSAKIEVRDLSNNNAPVFSVTRSGWLLKRDHVHDAEGQVIGRYKAKMFSLSGGFHVYDKDGKHLADIKGNMFKAAYKILSPDKKTEMGSVSRTWGGMAKSLFTGDDTYGVQIADNCANNPTAKILILGATLAVESIFKKKHRKSSGGDGSEVLSSGEAGEGESE